MAKPRFPGYATCLQMMRKRNPQTAEDGFHWLLSRAAEFVEPLMEEFRKEPNHGLRCWLLELIAEARDPRALELLTAELDSTDESLRNWAFLGLQDLNTHEARKALFAAAQPRKRGGSAPRPEEGGGGV